MDDASLRADCSACAGLCCVFLAFDRGPLFGFDKAAGEACRNLTEQNRCGIHDLLAANGFAGCARYDCLGAGQRVTALFAGLSWRDSPATARVMFEAFRKLRLVHELLLLVRGGAGGAWIEAVLDPPDGWSLASLLTLDSDSIAAEVRASVRRDILGGEGPP